ncbi:MAG: autotransporter domain-containing protein, partial [Pontixanthobacter sp.]
RRAVMLQGVADFTNLEGGLISGVRESVLSQLGNRVVNRGAMSGNVVFRAMSNGVNGGSSGNVTTFIQDGGTVEGSVNLGDGAGLFVQYGASNAISGTIDGGAGADLFALVFRNTGTATLGAANIISFEETLVQADGAETVLTLDASSIIDGSLYIGGDGSIINNADIGGSVFSGSEASNAAALAGIDNTLGSFINTGTVGGSVSLDSRSFANSGRIGGSVNTGSGANLFDNSGAIGGDVFLGGGDDIFVWRSVGTLVGTADGGAGNDLLTINALADGSVVGSKFANFERVEQVGDGTISYSGKFDAGTIELNGGKLVVESGNTLTTANDRTITAAENSVSIENRGIISGGIGLGDSADIVANFGIINGPVSLGAGDDIFVDGMDSATDGGVDGGAGNDLYTVVLSGDRSSIGQRDGFEKLGLSGPGTLTLSLDQDFDSIEVNGSNLVLSLGDNSVGSITGSASDETLTIDADVGSIDLGGGDDTLRFAEGSTFNLSATGGDGMDTVILASNANMTLSGGLTGFESLDGRNVGDATLRASNYSFDQVAIGGNLTIGTDAALKTDQLTFGADDNRLSIMGGFSGSLDGGDGTDNIDVAATEAGQTVAFGDISNVETLNQTAGFTTIAGSASADVITLTGGRLSGLNGSNITASDVIVGKAATFGSSGTISGNLSVAGLLNIGNSPGTMVVSGNVSLEENSVTEFVITPAGSASLLVRGGVEIADNATLRLAADRIVGPGRTLDLITATDGISGSFDTIVNPASVFGRVVQQAESIQLRGLFRNDADFSVPVQNSIAYVNDRLGNDSISDTFLSAVSGLADDQGRSQTAAFNQLTPQAYSSVQQISIENSLSITHATRSDAFVGTREDASFFALGSALGSYSTIEENEPRGISRARSTGYGVLGGIGFGTSSASVSAFGGIVQNDQNLSDLDARSDGDGVIVGLHGRYNLGKLALKATVAYDERTMRTRRTLVDGRAMGTYDLQGWTVDASVGYAMSLSSDWSVEPNIGATFIRSDRDLIDETGTSEFVASVEENRTEAFFIDGGIRLEGDISDEAQFKPHATLGVRYRADGFENSAISGFAGGPVTLVGNGVSRDPFIVLAGIGGDFELSEQLHLFISTTAEAGSSNRRIDGSVGLNFAL